jgi:flagellum-specific peptidoglycan hydrolase FlgJ
VDICKRYNKTKLIWIPNKTEALKYVVAENEILLTVHRWLFNTSCPGTWMMNHMEELAERVNTILSIDESNEQPEIETNIEVEQATEPSTDNSTPIDTAILNKNEIQGFQASQLSGLSNQQVIDLVAPLFIEDQKKSGILASVSLAQFLLETGYGRTVLCQAANNGFGMKTYLSGNTWPGSTWDGSSSYVMSTQEQNPDGSYFTYTEAFRKYPCLEDSISDHSAYLLNAPNGDKLRYQGLQGCKDYKHAFEIIYNGGYATSLTYVKELCMVVEMWNLTKYDIITQQELESNSQTSNTPNVEISTQDEIDKNDLLDQIIKLLADINKILLELRDK